MGIGQDTGLDEPVIDGPFDLFDGSICFEFLKPHPSRNASTLIRATYKAGHTLNRKGKGHPQVPPYHLHFNQHESFQVLSGQIGHTSGYACVDKVYTPSDTPKEGIDIQPWIPHTFWPVDNATEDSTLLMWAWPRDSEFAMDDLFFKTVLRFVSDAVVDKMVPFDGLQLMLSQQVDPLPFNHIHFDEELTRHATASALVWLPTWNFLGDLRWKVPYAIQAFFAFVARMTGRKPFLKQYLSKQDLEKLEISSKKNK